MLTESLAYCISILRKDFVSFCTEKYSELDVTYNQSFIILYIGKNADCCPSDICKFTGLDPGQLNRTLARLSEKGFVNQRKSEKDSRVTLLNLTEKGFEVYNLSHRLFEEWDNKIFKAFNDNNKKEELLSTMKELINNI